MRACFLKAVDRCLGPPLAALLPPPVEAILPSAIERALFIRPGGIGDAVSLAPTIRAFRSSLATAKIDILAERRNAGVFPLIPGIDRVFLYDRLRDLAPLWRSAYSIVIDTEQWHYLSAVVARLTGSVVIGYATNERSRLLNVSVPYAQDQYEQLSFQGLLAPLGVNGHPSTEGPFLEIPFKEMARSGELLSSLRGAPFVTLFPGASIPERRWGSGGFRELAGLLNRAGLSVVVVGGREEGQESLRIMAGQGGLNLAGQTSLAETAAVIDRSVLLVSGDSGLLHLAVGLGKPTVSLFGPGIARKWAPRGPGHIVINKNLPCSPCTRFGYTPRCPRGAECMRSITVQEVAEAVFSLLHRQQEDVSMPALGD